MTSADQFEHAWPYLAAALQRYGATHTKEQLRAAIESGSAQLWPMPHAAMVTSIETYPNGLRQLHLWLGGGDIAEILEWEPVITAWGKEQGCTRVQIAGRRGWLKTLKDYKEAGTVLAKEL